MGTRRMSQTGREMPVVLIGGSILLEEKVVSYPIWPGEVVAREFAYEEEGGNRCLVTIYVMGTNDGEMLLGPSGQEEGERALKEMLELTFTERVELVESLKRGGATGSLASLAFVMEKYPGRQPLEAAALWGLVDGGFGRRSNRQG